MRRTAKIATTLCLLALPISLASPADATMMATSPAWSGSVTPGGGYTSVTAQFVVPRVTAACGRDSNVAIFVGLGGWGSLPFVQDGVTVTPAGASAWYETFSRGHADPGVGVPLVVRPGDRVRISLSFANHGYYLTFRWENLTTRKTVNKAISNASRYYNGATADYVVERSNYPRVGSPLAAYGSVALQDARAARHGRWVPAADHNATLVTMRPGARTLATTSAPGGVVTSRWAACR